jgi:hypothetical protein
MRGKSVLFVSCVMGIGLTACGNGTSTSGPTFLPSGPGATEALCQTYFGTAAGIAKQFGVRSLVPARIADVIKGHTSDKEVISFPGTVACFYNRPNLSNAIGNANSGLTLMLTTHVNHTSFGGEDVSAGQSGKVYAYAQTFNPLIHVSEANQHWLDDAAARARPPR